MKTLLTILFVFIFTVISYAEVTVQTRFFLNSQKLSFNSMNITDNFNLERNYFPFEVKASWKNSNLELSYYYLSRRTFEGSSDTNFIFKDIKLEPEEKSPIFLSGSITTHRLEARLMAFSQYIAPTINWSYIHYSLDVLGKHESKDYILGEQWRNSSLGLGATAGYRINKLFLEAKGIIQVNRDGREFSAQAIWIDYIYDVGIGYMTRYTKFGPIEINNSGPFIQIGMKF